MNCKVRVPTVSTVQPAKAKEVMCAIQVPRAEIVERYGEEVEEVPRSHFPNQEDETSNRIIDDFNK